ncbi:hypothetical protein [Pedobacter jejuensis]|uniref:Uncharacterized protein n=1 Tax=Pedobacter jejuensis TaxID=1268550 RepID=A0A3N0BSY5_9SPHI|nr:hypothetical protein [Pedobacter jejuensis]RNL52166.1 hypothetical protein D7004_11315 [Pedobacter jejuensis]
MIKRNSRNIEISKVLLGGLQMAGDAIGKHQSKRTIGRKVANNVGLVNQILRFALNRKGSSGKLTKNIELGGLGAIALYNIYRGIKRKRNYLLLQGAFLTVSLAVSLLSSKEKDNNTVRK